MLQVEYTNQFKRDLKLSRRRNNDLDVLHEVMKLIENEKLLNPKFKSKKIISLQVPTRCNKEDSLEILIKEFHSKSNDKNLGVERRVVDYLRSLGI